MFHQIGNSAYEGLRCPLNLWGFYHLEVPHFILMQLSTRPVILQGVDPDAPDDDEENEVDDGEGDQEETELL